jgi:2,5-diamino-6-(ribosylamino)-4(3H)-pyrimidinone 5'-phosphate reductase
MSVDGKTALPSGKQLRLSSDKDIARVHQLRNENDAILVGVGTILSDDPKLTVKEKYVTNPQQPFRVILDGNCRTPANALVLNNAAETIIFTKKTCRFSFDVKHVCIYQIDLDDDGLLDLKIVLNKLSKRGIHKLLVEGGGTIIWNFLSQYLFDELYVYIAPVIVGGEQTPIFANGKGKSSFLGNVSLKLDDSEMMGEGILLKYKLN